MHDKEEKDWFIIDFVFAVFIYNCLIDIYIIVPNMVINVNILGLRIRNEKIIMNK